jgi:hypothetical protein
LGRYIDQHRQGLETSASLWLNGPTQNSPSPTPGTVGHMPYSWLCSEIFTYHWAHRWLAKNSTTTAWVSSTSTSQSLRRLRSAHVSINGDILRGAVVCSRVLEKLQEKLMRILRCGAPDGGVCHLQTNLLHTIIDQIHSTSGGASQDHATARYLTAAVEALCLVP